MRRSDDLHIRCGLMALPRAVSGSPGLGQAPRGAVNLLRLSRAASAGLVAPAGSSRSRLLAAALPVEISISSSARREAPSSSRFFAFSVVFDAMAFCIRPEGLLSRCRPDCVHSGVYGETCIYRPADAPIPVRQRRATFFLTVLSSGSWSPLVANQSISSRTIEACVVGQPLS